MFKRVCKYLPCFFFLKVFTRLKIQFHLLYKRMAQGGGKKLKKVETKRDLTKVRRKQQKPTRGMDSFFLHVEKWKRRV